MDTKWKALVRYSDGEVLWQGIDIDGCTIYSLTRDNKPPAEGAGGYYNKESLLIRKAKQGGQVLYRA